jgi:NADH:ubiquinone oxidoreductase subunit E
MTTIRARAILQALEQAQDEKDGWNHAKRLYDRGEMTLSEIARMMKVRTAVAARKLGLWY